MLSFNGKKAFRILIIADIQICRPLDSKAVHHLSLLLENSKPDLIVLLGDVIFGPLALTYGHVEKIIESVLAVINQRSIPFVFVTGNHDRDTLVTVQRQLQIYAKSPFCLTPPYSSRKCRDAYSFDIFDSGELPAVRLLFLDSGKTRLSSYGIDYSPASQEQLSYSDSLLNQKDCPPTFVFQHIPVLEIYQLIETVSVPADGSVKGHGPYRGDHLSLISAAHGMLGEAPCPPWQNSGQFRSWVNSKSVCAAVFGHDHKNSFEGTVDGITLLQTSCAGLTCYGYDPIRGGRILDINADGSFCSTPIYYSEII